MKNEANIEGNKSREAWLRVRNTPKDLWKKMWGRPVVQTAPAVKGRLRGGSGGAGQFHAHRRTPKNLRRYWRTMRDE
jgi:hypothetical protein